MELSQEVHNAVQEVCSATGADVTLALNRIFNRFLGWPFKAATGYATDRESNRTDTFGTVIYTTSDTGAPAEPVTVAADTLAAVIDVCESMDFETFRAAYQRIGHAKTLKKTPPPRLSGVAHTTTTLGIILAIRATSPLEKFAEELDRLNRQTPSAQWPDMVAVISTGVINYAIQFPGEQVSGDLLPPAEGAAAAHTMPTYVIMLIRPTADYTLNKLTAFLIAHLAIFSPGSKVPNFALVLRGVPQLAITLCGYQYNLNGDLLPVPRQFYNDRYIPPLPLRIEDRKGKLLSTVQFLPWQDGGAILLRGKLPLGGIVVYLGRDALKRGGVIRRGDDLQISYVLPIKETDFSEMLVRFERQSNMVVRAQSPRLVIQKVLDEGSQSPFIARLSMGILRLRDVVFPDWTQRDSFDKASEFVFMAFLNARAAGRQLVEAWHEHLRKVSQGEIAHARGATIQIDENIDKELKKEIESFLNAAARALKQGMQDVTRALQVNIGFLFQKPSPFAKGLAALAVTDPPLAEYLRETRTSWSEQLLQRRNAIEHEGWMLPRATYALDGANIKVIEPSISGQPVSEFVSTMIDRLACFIEEVTAHCLQMRMPAGITITELPLSQRAAEAPERFRVTLATGGMPIWRIAYHQDSFEET